MAKRLRRIRGCFGVWKRGENRATLSVPIKAQATLDSLVLLQSLQQTRQHHVQELFPIFTTSQGSRSKNKSKQAEEENSIPKHDIRLIGKCGLTVGPVSFQNVSLWECRFLEYQHPVPPPKPKTPVGSTRETAEDVEALRLLSAKPPPPVPQTQSTELVSHLLLHPFPYRLTGRFCSPRAWLLRFRSRHSNSLGCNDLSGKPLDRRHRMRPYRSSDV